MVPEAELEQTEAGLVPATGCDEYEAETFFPMLGMSIQVIGPGEPNGTYHWETEQEDFLVGAGEGTLVILAALSRQFQKDGPWGFYTIDETANGYNASPPEHTQDGEVAYGRFPPEQPARYREGLLPG